MLSLPSPSLFSFRIINKNIGVKVASQERPLRKFPKHRQRIKLNSNYPKGFGFFVSVILRFLSSWSIKSIDIHPWCEDPLDKVIKEI